jgi:hypothetical protein
MEEWVTRAMQRWPNVPALFGWLALDRRGRWLIRGESITRLQIIDTINRNYASDEHGRWFFQNGPQRGYVQLASAPFILRPLANDRLETHTGRRVERPTAAYLDEDGSLLVATEHGPGEIAGDSLDWALRRLRHRGWPVTEQQLAQALAADSGAATALTVLFDSVHVPIMRLDFAAAPAALGFVRDPQPLDDEVTATVEQD